MCVNVPPWPFLLLVLSLHLAPWRVDTAGTTSATRLMGTEGMPEAVGKATAPRSADTTSCSRHGSSSGQSCGNDWSRDHQSGAPSLHYPTIECSKRRSAQGLRHCRIDNVYGEWPDRRKCLAAVAAFPVDEAEVLEAVAGAVRRRQAIKVATATGHSIPPWACARGSKGLIISTQNLNRRIDVDQSAMLVRVDAGVQLRELVDTLARAGLALRHSPYWDAMTVGGLLSTGSHGSSMTGKGGAVHEYVVAMRLVVPAPAEQGSARVVQLSARQDPLLFEAARVSLGLLGVISQVTLEVEPQFKRAIEKEIVWQDADMEDRMLGFGLASEFGDVTWLPSVSTLVMSREQRVPLDTPGLHVNAFHPFLPTHVLVRSALRLIEDANERSAALRCATAAFISSVLLRHGLSLSTLRKGMGPTIGYNHQVQASGSCARSRDPNWACPWARPGSVGYFYHETTFTLSMENATLLLKDMKKLRELAGPPAFCGIDFYAGILLRFVTRSTAYLGHQVDGISMDITYYRAYHAHDPRLDEDIYEEVEQMALFKYGAWPHWGKNRPLAFAGLPAKYPNLDKFLLAKKALDPEGLFSSEWSDSVLGIKGNVSSDDDYCALEGRCVCREDRHCAPDRGYFCQPGRVYREARVCRATKKETMPQVMKLVYVRVVSWMQTCISSPITLVYDLIIYMQQQLTCR